MPVAGRKQTESPISTRSISAKRIAPFFSSRVFTRTIEAATQHQQTMASSSTISRPPPPSAQALHLVSALSNPEPADVHVNALKARDEALSSSPETYGSLASQLACCLVGCDQASDMLARIAVHELEAWRVQDGASVSRLQQNPALWIPFGQMAGLILKNALLRPPASAANDGRPMTLQGQAADQTRDALLFALGCQHAALRAVASTVIATSSVSTNFVQPALHVTQWKTLVPALVRNLQGQGSPHAIEGSLATVQKMMEDGPSQLDQEELDLLIPALLRYLSADAPDTAKLTALRSFVACLGIPILPSSMIRYFSDYMAALSALATSTNPLVRQWVCRSIVTLLENRSEYLQEQHFQSVIQFMLLATADTSHPAVALEACEFWLTFATLDESVVNADRMGQVAALLPQLLPILLQNMVYSGEQREEILIRNEQDMEGQSGSETLKPVFHRSRARQSTNVGTTNAGGSSGDIDDDGYDQDDEDDEDDFEDETDGNEWTLRKCAAASLDSLANLYGDEPILPCLLPALEQGLSSSDPWVQEASILALGAVAEGCQEAMEAHMSQLHPYLMNHLATAGSPNTLPQVKSIAAWTLGRYASWAVEQVQSGAQGHLLAELTEVFMSQLGDRNRRVQVAVCSAFSAMAEVAGDLLTPYLEHIYRPLIAALSVYQGRSLTLLLDVMGTMADCCGSSIAEGNLPMIYIPPLMQMWDHLAKHDPSDRTLLPLMESLASIAVTTGMNFQPFALESFENAMGMIEAVQLIMASSGERFESEEEADPIVCSLDLLDGLVEGMGENFQTLVSSSRRFSPHFLSVVHRMCQHEVAGVRMSAFALVGDLARTAPGMLEPGLPQLIHEAVENMDPIQFQVCSNAVWATGEICIRCRGNPSILEPHVAALMQNLVALLVGNGPGDHVGATSGIPGLAENAAACVGRLAQVNPAFVSPELPRFMLGWCDGLARIADPTERHDAFEGFVQAVYSNPNSIQQSATNASDAIASIIFAIVSWHMPTDLPERSVLLKGDYNFQPFPTTEAELGSALQRLVQDMKTSVGDDTWHTVQFSLPVNVRRLLRECYNV
jgi:transportin-1